MTTATREVPITIHLRGGNWQAYNATEPEILVEGGAGTGKTFGILLRINRHAQENPGYRGLIVRKTAVTLGSTVLRTFEEEVLHEWELNARRSMLDGVHFFGGSTNEPSSYEYDNGSRIVVGGMDQASKVLGSDYDEIYVNEATEVSIEDLETLKGRLRHGVLSERSLICDCNPSFERHFLLQRCNSGAMRRIKTTLRDNPAYYDDRGELTALGAGYLASLEGMTGTRRQRFLLGEWIGMENAIYPQLDPQKHLAKIPDPTRWEKGAGGVDYGKVHLSAVVAVRRASTGIVWVVECEVLEGGNEQKIEDIARGMKLRHKLSCGEVDPIQEVLGQRLGWPAAKMGAGTRKARIEHVYNLLDNGALMFDQDGPGVRDLVDEMLGYRYEVRETDTTLDDVVVRKDDDRVAALEDAVEALTAGVKPYGAPSRNERREPARALIGRV